jgi:thiol-disulfide isomerase/thioredoxin
MKMMTFLLALCISVVLVACAPEQSTTPVVTDEVNDVNESTETEPTESTETNDEIAQATSETAQDTTEDTQNNTFAYDAPAWANITLTNARTGETFAFSDLAGKAVMVHGMATWCSNCRQQQGNVRTATSQFNDDDVVFISMSVENNLADVRLAEYADDNLFDWTFVVAPPELLTALTEQFGRTITNPPATPRFFIAADGTVSDLRTGMHSVDEIVNEVQTVINSVAVSS